MFCVREYAGILEYTAAAVGPGEYAGASRYANAVMTALGLC